MMIVIVDQREIVQAIAEFLKRRIPSMTADAETIAKNITFNDADAEPIEFVEAQVEFEAPAAKEPG